MKPSRFLSLLTLAIAGVLPASAADRLEQWFALMPKGTAAVISVKNTPELLADWDESAFAAFMQDEAVQRWTAPMRQNGDAPWDKFFKEQYGSGMYDVLKDYPGALVNFLVLDDFEDFKDNPPSVSLCEVAGKQAEIEAHKVAEVEAERKEKADLKIETVELGGVSAKIVTENPEADACFTSWAFLDDVMIESTSRKLLEQMIVAVKSGSGDPPADARDHLARIGQMTNGGGDMMLYVNGVKMLELGRKAIAEAEKEKKGGEADAMAAMGITPQVIMNMLGVDELQALAFTMEMEAGKMRTDFAILHPEKPVGLVSVMRTTANEVTLPDFIPGDVLQGGVTRYDFGKFYDSLMGMITKLGPMAMMVTMQIPQFEQQLGFNIRNDFLGSLEDEISSVQDGQLEEQSQVMVFKVKNPEKLGGALNSLKQFVGAGFGAFEEADFLGYKVNTLKLSQTANAATEMAYCNTGKHLLISVGAQETLNKVLARMKDPSGPAIWDNPQVEKLLAAVPPNYGGATVADVGSMVSMLATAAATLEAQQKAGQSKAAKKKKGPGKKAPAQSGDESSGQMLDSDAIPSKEVFQRYFGRMLGTQYSHPDAVQIHYLIMQPAE
ncbi:MAG: hypothetical protein R3F13_13625 [Prosthecobacter sp.]